MATVISEIINLILMKNTVKKVVPLRFENLQLKKISLAVGIMGIIICVLQKLNLNFVIIVLISAVVYGVALLIERITIE